MMKRLLLIGLSLLLIAAAKPAGPQPIAYRDAIDRYFAQSLKDPASVSVYRVSDLFEATYPLGGFKKQKLWTACVQINAKNSYGGYTGIQTHAVFFEGNEIKLVYEAWRVLVGKKEKCPGGDWQEGDRARLAKP